MKNIFKLISMVTPTTLMVMTSMIASAAPEITKEENSFLQKIRSLTESNADVDRELRMKAKCPFETYTIPVGSKTSSVEVVFVKRKCLSREDYSKVKYSWKLDQAELQQEKYQLSDEMRNAITPEDINSMTQEEIDQLYIRSTSGPIVPAEYQGSIVFNSQFSQIVQDKLQRKLGENGRLGKVLQDMLVKVCSDKKNLVKCAGELLWAGKKIYAPTEELPVYQLRNGINKVAGAVVYGALNLDNPASSDSPQNTENSVSSSFAGIWSKMKSGAANLVDTAKAQVALGRTSRSTEFNGEKYMLFPAKVYCGQSLYDHRRESIIIDYAWGSDLPHLDKLDDLAGRNGFDVRDEIRMIRPGLYLGRAYMNKIFLLNFVLENKDPKVAEVTESQEQKAEKCFDGTTTR